MNRRDFIKTAGSTAAFTLSNQAAAATVTLKDLNLKMPVEDRIRLIQSFVHTRYYDNIGLLYSHINFEEERPHTAAD